MIDMTQLNSSEKTAAYGKGEFLKLAESMGLEAEISETTLNGNRLTTISLGKKIALSGKEPAYAVEQTERGKVAHIKWANRLKYRDATGNEKNHENTDRLEFEGSRVTLHSHHVSPEDGVTLAVLEKDEKGRFVEGGNGRYKTRKVEDPSEAKMTATFEISESGLAQR